MCISRVSRFFSQLYRQADIPPGLYHYVRETEGRTARFHLRVDAGGDGLLLANAAAVARLSPSGVVIAKGLLDGDDLATITQRIRKMFCRVRPSQITADLAEVESLIRRMQSPGGNYPVLNLTDPAFSPKAMPLARPISADVPLCQPDVMNPILDRLWELSIPQVTILAGKSPDSSTLTRAVERAGDLGLITGVRGRGSDLNRGKQIAEMITAGLDHLDVCCLSHRPEIHDALAGEGDHEQALLALEAAREQEICPVAQIALVRSTLTGIEATLERLVGDGIQNVGLFAIAATDPAQASAGALLAHELPPIARIVEDIAQQLGLRLFWYPTVRFDPSRPLGEQVCDGPRCSGDTAIRVEPDGSVYPARGPWRSAGNLISDDWETIRQSDVYQAYRRRVESDTHCDQCPGLAICAADCPREPAGWAGS